MINRLTKYLGRTGMRLFRSRPPLAQVPDIKGKRFLFVCGLHRSGTSILHRLLREHDDVSGFEKTGVAEDEGQHLQSVIAPAHHHGTPGTFAFDLRAHLTEESSLNTPANRDCLLREWGAYYDLSKKIMLEKSPPNLIRTRFFQALLPESCFVFIVRHPLSVALATKKWANANFVEILFHWHTAHSIMMMDMNHLENNYIVIRYEDLIAEPGPHLDRICGMVGLEPFMPRSEIRDHNSEYFSIWERQEASTRSLIERLFNSMEGPAQLFGYRLSGDYVGEISSVQRVSQ